MNDKVVSEAELLSRRILNGQIAHQNQRHILLVGNGVGEHRAMQERVRGPTEVFRDRMRSSRISGLRRVSTCSILRRTANTDPQVI